LPTEYEKAILEIARTAVDSLIKQSPHLARLRGTYVSAVTNKLRAVDPDELWDELRV
jgi:hypothetical protein